MPTLVSEPQGVGTKKARTRARLVNTAVRIFAEKGISDTSILEITKSADVSNGTFYAHFRDKDELVNNVGELLVEHVLDEMHAHIDTVPDPAVKIALAVQWLIGLAERNPDVGSIMAQTLVTVGTFRHETLARVRADIVAGVERGVLVVDDVDLMSVLVNSTTLAAIRTVIGGESLEHVQLMTAETHLRMLGLSPSDAAATAHRAHVLMVEWPPRAEPVV